VPRRRTPAVRVFDRRHDRNPPRRPVNDRNQIQKPPTHRDVWVSRPEGFHLQPLAEPDVNLSAHPAPTIRPTIEIPATNERTHPAAFCGEPPEHLRQPVVLWPASPLCLRNQPPDQEQVHVPPYWLERRSVEGGHSTAAILSGSVANMADRSSKLLSLFSCRCHPLIVCRMALRAVAADGGGEVHVNPAILVHCLARSESIPRNVN